MIWHTRKQTMITADDALPGRAERMPVPERHDVLGTPMQEPFPGMELALHEGGLEDLCQRLEAGDLDLAILSSPQPLDPNLRSEPVYQERYVVVFPPGHEFEERNDQQAQD